MTDINSLPQTRWWQPTSQKQDALGTHSPCWEPIRLNGFYISAREFIHRGAIKVYELFGADLDGILEELSQALVG